MAEATVSSMAKNDDEVAMIIVEPKAKLKAEVPTCPNCGATEFKKVPNDRPEYALVCQGCRMGWHETDLVGERFEYLKAKQK